MFQRSLNALLATGLLAGAVSAQSVTTTTVRGDGNRVIVSGSGADGVSVTTNDLGQNNSVIVTHNGKVVLPKHGVYKGKANKFWTKSVWDAGLNETLYFCPQSKLWYSYLKDKDLYQPSSAYYDREAKRATAEGQKALQEANRLLRGLDDLLRD